jgi:hypothetical protein
MATRTLDVNAAPPEAEARHEPLTVLIASEALLAGWTARVGNATQVVAVAATEPDAVVAALSGPRLDSVVIEQAIATTASGFALMDRLLGDRLLRGTQVRLLTPDRAVELASSDPGEVPPHDWLRDLSDPLPPRPERRAARFPAAQDEQAFIDGQAVTLIDLSAVGAQVRSASVLRPGQRIRMVLSPARGSVKTVAVVMWSQFEIAGTRSYRAGLAFTSPIQEPA